MDKCGEGKRVTGGGVHLRGMAAEMWRVKWELEGVKVGDRKRSGQP